LLHYIDLKIYVRPSLTGDFLDDTLMVAALMPISC
jgi:hypothetical protein